LLIYLNSFIFHSAALRQTASIPLAVSVYGLGTDFFTVAAKFAFRHLKDLIVNFSPLTELQIQKVQ